MQEAYLELKIEEVRVENPLLISILKDSFNVKEFKDD